jgi:hypothetical protein
MIMYDQAARSFSVWHDLQEQWDPDHIDEPQLRCQALSSVEAAEKLADLELLDRHGRFIVRDEEAGTYRCVELVRGWSVKTDMTVTLEELCAP